ncbi:sensor histidine kinase [Enterococcus diestrammenae]|uniref:histidine kinase n=1 Tax=Enterococcus diestrammenae TaxID=1155073 RepID=A0ABV0F3B7_9ENTE|nr:HAMP domain-containing sensor histidine kinase [Enterococcus diestrammenae]KAF1296513.1 two-component sensor histidine kinase [Enterococcus diestrammenae]
MRYLYQQLMAFWVVIAVVLLIVGVSFTQLTRHTIEENNYKQLYSYASSTIDVAQTYANRLGVVNDPEAALQESFRSTEGLFSNQHINLVYINDQNEIIYPVEEEARLKIKSQLDNLILTSQWQAVKTGQRLGFTNSKNIFGQSDTTAYVMLSLGLNDKTGVLLLTQPATNVEDSAKSLNMNLFKGFIISSIVAVIISFFYASIQVRRINRMKNATREVASGNFDVRIPVHNRDEFDELAEDFNKMTTALQESNDEIQRQEERRKEFMANASHEMRTPLTTINGLLEGLQYNAIPENQKDNALRLMKNETERLIRLVNENLDYEKIRTNQISIVVKKFDATETLRTLLTQLKPKAEAAGDQLFLTTEEPVSVYADYDRFMQIMVNIIQNAIQFTTDGTIKVALSKGYLETIVEITDTGIGMTEDQLNNIWERYYKADPSRKNRKVGESGLGLAIVQQLVRLHKGKIDVASELGVGTTFRISFPDVELAEDGRILDPEEKPSDKSQPLDEDPIHDDKNS